MKYYLVNFLVCCNNTIWQDNTIAISIPMDTYDCSSSFKKQIDKQMRYSDEGQAIVIKTYRQISEDIFTLVHPFIKQNLIQQAGTSINNFISYKFLSSNYTS